jgi:hypothetical protein
MADKLVTITKYTDFITADLAKQLLADFGIEAVVTGQHAANVYSGVPALAHIELQTLESQAQKAREILESGKQQEQ